MRKTAIVIGLMACLLSVLGAAAALAGNGDQQTRLTTFCQNLQYQLVLPAGTSAAQRTHVALDIAIAYNLPLDESVDLAEVLRKVSDFTVYGVMSDTFYTWDGEAWVGSHRSTYTYSGIRETGETEQVWDVDSSKWLNSSKSIIAYNIDGTLMTMTEQEWSEGACVNTYLISYSYSGGLTDTMWMKVWSGSDWVNSMRSILSYSSGKLVTTLSQQWQTSVWVNMMKTDYTYSGGLVSEAVSQLWTGGAWMNSSKVSYSYNASNLKTQEVHQTYAGVVWTNSIKTDYTYNGSNNEILRVNSDWSGAAWSPTDADTTKWSGDDEIEVVHNHFVDGWLSRTQYTYDANHNGILDLSQDWSGSSWENGSRAVYVYAVLAVEIDRGRQPEVFELGQNYPNPFNPITAIRYSLHRPSLVNITVFNVLGQEVKTLEQGMQAAGSYETTWDGTDQAGQTVASGVYFYRITAGNYTETRKMVLLK